MIKVEEATEEDFDKIYALLMQLNSTTISRKTWQKTFKDPFNAKGPPGYILKDDEQVVGFLGTIFSKRLINNQEVTFCNMHSWIVEEKYRRNGLLLLSRIHKLRDVVLTNFSASTGPFQILKQLKWKEVDNSHSIFYRHLLKFQRRTDLQVLKGEELNDVMSEDIKNIAAHHKSFRCAINVIKTGKGSALQVFKPVPYFPARFSVLQRLLPDKFSIGQLFYTSNPELFFADFQRNIQVICKKEGWVGIVIPNRMLQKAGIVPGKKYFAYRPILAKTNLEFDLDQLDLLYSEVFILDLK